MPRVSSACSELGDPRLATRSPLLLQKEPDTHLSGASHLALMIKNLPSNAGDTRDKGSIPESGRSPGGGRGNPLQCSCLENPMDRAAWWATVHGVAQNQT